MLFYDLFFFFMWIFYDLKLCALNLIMAAVCELKFGAVTFFFFFPFLIMADINCKQGFGALSPVIYMYSKDLVPSAFIFLTPDVLS